jgi:hypothetical protein
MSKAAQETATSSPAASGRRPVGRGRALAEKMIKAHGGLAAWEQAESVEFKLRGGGLLLASKRQPGKMDNVTITVPTTGQKTVVAPYPEPGKRGVFESGRVRIEDDAGQVLEERDDPRPLFRRMSRQLRWDDLDLLYFSGYALWNYISVPFVLLREGYKLEQAKENALKVTFPEGVHTHCKTQRFLLDENGLLQRHLYTAEPVGRWARSVHVASEHREFDGLVFPTKRRVYPRGLFGVRVPFPVLVSIDVSEFKLPPTGSRSREETRNE